MSTKTDIANMALGHIGISASEVDVDTSKTIDAQMFNLYYDDAIKRMYEKYKPKFAQKWENLALVEENPNDDWSYSFRYPVDCVMVLGIGDTRIGETTYTDVRYTIASDATGLLIFTDFNIEATAHYVQNFTSVNDMPASVRMGLSYEMAALIAPSLSQKAPVNSLALAEKFLGEAMVHQRGQEGQGDWPISSAIRARG